MSGFNLEDAPIRRYQHLDWDSGRWTGFKPRSGDIYICTCYKSGTTWTQMIVALLVFQELDFPLPLNELSPWIDLVTDSIEEMHKRLSAQRYRRILKTHTPLDGLKWHADARYLFVGRDPRDVFVSMMNHQDNTDVYVERKLAAEMGNKITITDLLADTEEERLKDWLTRGYFEWDKDGYPYWSLFHHGETFWQHRNQENILVLHYGEMKCDLDREMRKIAAHLAIEINEEVFPSLVEAARFASMKPNAEDLAPAAEANLWKNNSEFFANGTNGQWQDRWSKANLQRLDALSHKYSSDYMEWLLESKN